MVGRMEMDLAVLFKGVVMNLVELWDGEKVREGS